MSYESELRKVIKDEKKFENYIKNKIEFDSETMDVIPCSDEEWDDDDD